jgi:hypothetical protein
MGERRLFGLDHVGPRWVAPKLERWRRAAFTEVEVGLAAAVWSDGPFDLFNALAAHRSRERSQPVGQLTMWEVA